jgi:hypothetical protein
VFAVGDESPAVVSLLGRRRTEDGFVATLLDLTARGWFRLTPESSQEPPVVTVLPAPQEQEELTACERMVKAHVASKASAIGEVPVAALWKGFKGGKTNFMREFREAAAADAARRGLARPYLSTQWIVSLCALLLIAAAGVLFATHPGGHPAPYIHAVFYYLVFANMIRYFGCRVRPTETGREAAERWRVAAGSGGGRMDAYAAALGLASDTAAALAQP